MIFNHSPIIKHACSLGTICQSSQLCKDLQIRKESYPFDWIFSTPDIIVDILEDDFASFLDKDLYESMHPSLCKHRKYVLPRNGSYMFMHHNPKDNIDNYNYFVRCVDRFRKLLTTSSNKLFIINYPNKQESDIDSLQASTLSLINCLDTKTINYFLFAIFHVSNYSKCEFNITEQNNTKFLTFYSKSTTNGIHLTCAEEDLLMRQQLESSYQFQVEPLK